MSLFLSILAIFILLVVLIFIFASITYLAVALFVYLFLDECGDIKRWEDFKFKPKGKKNEI